MEQFENDVRKIAYIPAKFVRAPKGVTTHFYEDGKTDELFKVYLLGLEYGRSLFS